MFPDYHYSISCIYKTKACYHFNICHFYENVVSVDSFVNYVVRFTSVSPGVVRYKNIKYEVLKHLNNAIIPRHHIKIILKNSIPISTNKKNPPKLAKVVFL